MDGSSSQLDPCTPPNDYHMLHASYEPSQETKPLLEPICWSIILIFSDNSNFRCVLCLDFPCMHPIIMTTIQTQSVSNKRKLLDSFYSHSLISIYHACYNNSHGLIWKQDKHFSLYSWPRFQLMKILSINTSCCFHDQIHKTTNVTSTQKEVRAMWNTQNQ